MILLCPFNKQVSVPSSSGVPLESSMASSKRPLDEYDELCLASTPSKSARVHGIVTQLSPMKSGKYFDGKLSDDTSSVRIVGFDKKKQRELVQLQNEAVVIENCQIVKSKYSEEMEVLLSSATKFETSPKKFNFPSIATSMDNSVDNLYKLQDHQVVKGSYRKMRSNQAL